MNRPPKTKLVVALGGAFLAFSALTVNAVGLGKLSVSSALGQPLEAEIDLVSLQPGEFDAISARVASPESYSDSRIEYSPLLRQLYEQQVCLQWHEAFNKMEYGGVPVIAALKGAVVGGGLELASAAHIRIADASTYFALPEGQRGLFTGGGATIRVADLVGKARMIDMMLTGRVYQGQEAIDLGLAQYLVEGSSFDYAMDLARKAAQNLPLTNFAICSAISHMQNMSAFDAAFAEACVAGVVNTQPLARSRLEAFVNKTAARVRPNG